MRTAPASRLLAALAFVLPLTATGTEAQVVPATQAFYTTEELENLLAPVALYPDPILAQVLVAASWPDEVEIAARHVELYGQNHIDEQPWDISVKAVAHYPPVLNLMADRMDWTVALGQAYAQQPDEVMAAVQSLRAMARAHGNLVSTAEHEVVVEDRYIRIVPAHPRVVYVPVYDPLVVYHRPVVHLGVYRAGWSFGVSFPIGVWLAYDFDWRHRHVFYHGWDVRRYRHAWIHRARPFIVINNIYVNPRPTVVVVNRGIIHRRVDYTRFDRYNTVHRRVAWDRPRGGDPRGVAVGRGPSWDRDRRGIRVAGEGDRGRVWDGRGSEERGVADRRAVPRSSSGSAGGRGAGVASPRGDRAGSNASDWRAVPRSSATERGVGGVASPRERAQPLQRATPQQRSQPSGVASPRERALPLQRATPQQRSQPSGVASPRERAQPLQGATPQQRSQPSRVITPRAQAQPRGVAERARSTTRAQTRQPVQTTRSAPTRERAQPQRSDVANRVMSSRGGAPAQRAQPTRQAQPRSGAVGRAGAATQRAGARVSPPSRGGRSSAGVARGSARGRGG